MKISASSWHWRLFSVYAWSDNHRARYKRRVPNTISLCPYVRGVVRGFFMSVVVMLLGLMGSMVILDPIISGILYLTHGFFDGGFFMRPAEGEVVNPLIMIALMIASAMLALVVMGLGIVGYENVKHRVRMRQYERTNNTEEDDDTSFSHLVYQWYKSFHDKICPIITVEKEKAPE